MGGCREMGKCRWDAGTGGDEGRRWRSPVGEVTCGNTFGSGIRSGIRRE